ncbi:hypothetical protein ACQ4PT_049250 [Festuca glaucescens]
MLFTSAENGVFLDGSELKLSDGSVVGEYIIGDEGYPLRPWLLRPYKLDSDLSDPDYKEFNRRHSEALGIPQKALARLKDTWKCMQGEGWHPHDEKLAINACVLLHNIVIDMEELGGEMPNNVEHYMGQVVRRQVSDEDAVKVRDALSQHLIKSRVHTMAVEEEQVAAASGLGDESKEQAEARQRQRADRGKEKVHDS